MENFDKAMSNTSDLELYKILNLKRGSYKEEAILSAEKEFEKRNISQMEIEDFQQNIENENKLRNERKSKNISLEKTVRETINLAIPTEKSTLEKSILSLTIFLSITYLYFLISNFQDVIWILEEVNMWSVYSILPFILFPIGIYGLWKVKSYGWNIIVGLFTHFTILAIYQLNVEYGYYGAFEQDGIIGEFNDLFPKPPIGVVVLNIIILSGIVYYLNRKKVIKYFSIKRLDSIVYISLVVFFTILMKIYIF